MAKILAFAGSNSSTSINHELLQFIQLKYSLMDMEIISLRDLKIPMYGIDAENLSGFPDSIEHLYQLIADASKIVIASPEHNGNMTSYLKSTIDWLSRLERDFIRNKLVYVLGTSPGRGGASSSIENLKKLITRLGGNVITEFSLPSFNHSFEDGEVIPEFAPAMDNFVAQLNN